MKRNILIIFTTILACMILLVMCSTPAAEGNDDNKEPVVVEESNSTPAAEGNDDNKEPVAVEESNFQISSGGFPYKTAKKISLSVSQKEGASVSENIGYTWSITESSEASKASINGNESNVTFVPDLEGYYLIQCEVKNDKDELVEEIKQGFYVARDKKDVDSTTNVTMVELSPTTNGEEAVSATIVIGDVTWETIEENMKSLKFFYCDLIGEDKYGNSVFSWFTRWIDQELLEDNDITDPSAFALTTINRKITVSDPISKDLFDKCSGFKVGIYYTDDETIEEWTETKYYYTADGELSLVVVTE